MKLYHFRLFLLLILGSLVFHACAAPPVTPSLVNLRITVDGKTADLQLPAGSTVQDVLNAAQVTLGPLDRSDPPLFTVLQEGSQVRVIRVTEEFSLQQEVIPFEKQVLRNESLPEGEVRLVQPGKNGLREITVRRVFEDAVQVAQYEVKSVIIQEPVAEVEMVGSQNPFTQLEIPGRLVYLSAGNAWMMEGTTANRVPIVSTGDLDGRIFKLSPDRQWLLYTRRASEGSGNINSLWAINIDKPEQVFDLKGRNVIHFADWLPNANFQVIYSTVEPREAPPGWQANNDLRLIEFSLSGWVSPAQVILETNFGGIYGWWGTSFAWSKDGSRLLYSRPDGIGLVDLSLPARQRQITLLDITPLQTQSDWAWVPGTSWDPSEDLIFTVWHAAAPDSFSPEASPLFDLVAVPQQGKPITLVQGVGMFAYPVPSPLQPRASGEQAYQLAYLQAIFPTQSNTSRYRLVVMDRDGSDRVELFPEQGVQGLDPQRVVWSPQPFETTQSHWIALLYQGNLWMIDPASRESRQLTGDGLMSRLDWR